MFIKKILLLTCILFITVNSFAISWYTPNLSIYSNEIHGAQIDSQVRLPFNIMQNYIGTGVPLFPEFKSAPINDTKSNDVDNKYYFVLKTQKRLSLTQNSVKLTPSIIHENDSKYNAFCYTDVFLDSRKFIDDFLLAYFIALSESNLPYDVITFV